jgi:hypothetical protein
MQRRFVLALSPLVAVLAAVASGCGGGSSNSSAATPATTTTSTTGGQTAADKALFTYAACMRGKGVNIPDPVRGANGRSAFPRIPAKVTSAAGVRAKAQACAAKLPQQTFGRAGAQSPAQRAAFQKFSACMRENGVMLAGPGGQGRPPVGQGRPVRIIPGQGPRTGRGQGPSGPGGFFNSTNPKEQAAFAKCRKLLPTGFGNRGAP